MQVINTPISPYIQNAPIAYCEETKKCIFVDPGDELEKLIDGHFVIIDGNTGITDEDTKQVVKLLNPLKNQ